MDTSGCTRIKDIAEDTVAPAEVDAFVENENKLSDDGLGKRWKFWRRRRYIIVIMIFLGEITKGILRSNFSIAIFPMTENSTVSDENDTEIIVQEFDWDRKTRGFILSVFFYGYIATCLPGGLLALKFGGAKVCGTAIILTSIATLITPAAAHIHLYLLIAVRIFEGMCEGTITSSIELVVTNWIPTSERSSCIGLALIGSSLGHVIGVALSAWIGFHWGWQDIFYCTGGVGVFWFAAWLHTTKEYPELDKNISLSELTFIRSSFGRTRVLRSKVSSVPCVKIIASTPVWAILFGYAAVVWYIGISLTQYPAYIKDVLRLDYHDSGYLSTLPFIINMLTILFISPITDHLTAKSLFTLTNTRKVFICGGLAMMALFDIVIQQVNSATSVIVCLAAKQIFSTTCTVQLAANVIDIASKYSTLIIGLMTTVLSLCNMLSPTVAGYLTQNKTPEEWHVVFSIQSGICVLGSVLYGVFGSGQLQPWAAQQTRDMPADHLSDNKC